jgi:hypothetical protein
MAEMCSRLLFFWLGEIMKWLNSIGAANGERLPLLGVNPAEQLKHRLSVDEQVTKDTPPTFPVHSSEDATVPVENSL